MFTKEWTYRRRKYVMEKRGYGEYILNGFHCTDSEIWDWADDAEDLDAQRLARKRAEIFVTRKLNN